MIGPHPGLGDNQRAGVEKDCAMKSGTKWLEVRYAMLFYPLKRLSLLDKPETKAARTQHIIFVNAGETDQALRRADWAL
ncbi:hypothetical protein Q4F19_08380 [Sphingomonas sp. BIUV-7]|uniref:DNA-binding transcriptional repressor CapW C-terminal dimerisation domain-containing protein n=1 Tax=Sphingomonas natans TaxID=3063330 RepID=A0ABT8Y7W5_9SPHN|nr:hypothetical protein [Sphingomonas sp. BIUV-7]MDO6414395.1 hypothetical protein [Sphingomonas sp. BIUV-7]